VFFSGPPANGIFPGRSWAVLPLHHPSPRATCAGAFYIIAQVPGQPPAELELHDVCTTSRTSYATRGRGADDRKKSGAEGKDEQGDSVRKGQQLLTIETDQIAADGMDVNATGNARASEEATRYQRQGGGAAGRSGAESAYCPCQWAPIRQIHGQIKMRNCAISLRLALCESATTVKYADAKAVKRGVAARRVPGNNRTAPRQAEPRRNPGCKSDPGRFGSPVRKFLISRREFGAGEGIRTLDPNLGKVVLYP
jgi:hypothetical protein